MKAYAVAALALAAAAAMTVLWWQADHRAGTEAQARQQTEADLLTAQGIVVAKSRTAAGLEAELERVAGESTALRQELDKARAAVRVKVIEVVTASTGPVPVSGEPLPPSAIPCLLPVGGQLELQVRDVRARTEAGNLLVLGSAQAWRVEPRTLLVDAPFTASSAYVAPAPVPKPWWHSALWAGAGFAAGAVAGAVLAR